MTRLEQYNQFLLSKICAAKDSGIEDFILSDYSFKDGTQLKPHQKDAIEWAVRGGQRALFESFGLGKTIQQLIICNEILARKGGKALIVCPLGVRQEFKKDAQNKIGIPVYYITTQEEADALPEDSICLTNYERVRDGNIDPLKFIVCSLDEASVLRSDNSKTHHTFIQKFKGVRFKYVATATPSPNEFIELIYYAAFLEIMDKGQCKTRFFKRDSTKADNLTLYPHKEKEFWLWLSTWALFITKPSDLGYSDEGYNLPEMKIVYHEVPVDHTTAKVDRDGQGSLLREAALGLGEAAAEKRESLPARIGKMVEILKADPDSHYVIWHDLEAERYAIEKAWPEAETVYGTQKLEIREDIINGFASGDVRYLATKPEIAGSGCNFQYHCHKEIFVGIGFKFNDFIQAIHRVHRFQQKETVEIHIIYAESEREILKKLQWKWDNHNKLVEQMTTLVRENGLSSTNMEQKLMRSMGVTRQVAETKNYKAVLNDCVYESFRMEDNSVGLIHSSLPFSIQYEYSPSYNDFGHNIDNAAFFQQMDFLIPELYRMLMPGRLAVIHVKDRILPGNFTGIGFPTVYPFSDETIKAFTKHGFYFCGRRTIVTDVVRENGQTYRLGWTQNSLDGAAKGCGMSEYVLLFRKPPSDSSRGYSDIPVPKSKTDYSRARWQIDAHGFWRSSGNRFTTPEELRSMKSAKIQQYFKQHSLNTVYSYEDHVVVAEELEKAKKLPKGYMIIAPESWSDDTWTDIVRIKTLNTSQSMGRKTMHLCPLQFDVVDRTIEMYSNKGEIVYDPFGGLFTVPVRAVKLGRIGWGCELNHLYYRDGLHYLRAEESKTNSPTLFDLMEIEQKQTA